MNINDLSVKALKPFGQYINTFKFFVRIPTIPAISMLLPTPGIGLGTELTFLIRSTNIPGKRRETEKIRLGRTSANNTKLEDGLTYEYTIPKLSTYDHTWNVVALMPEKSLIYDYLWVWFESCDSDKYDLDTIRTDAYISLNSLNNAPNRTIKIEGIYPTNVPSIEGLDYDQVDGYIKANLEFSFDSINHNTLFSVGA